MSEGVVVALVTLAGVALTQIVIFVLSRLNANDLRTNIDREIEIIRKLDPASSEARKLAVHVSASIDELIDRDERRSGSNANLRVVGTGWVAALFLYGISIWDKHGIPKDIRPLVLVFSGVLAGVVILILWKQALDFYQELRISISKSRIWWMKRRAKIKIKGHRREAQEMYQAAEDLINSVTPYKTQIIDAGGLEMWDRIEATYSKAKQIFDEAEQAFAEAEQRLNGHGKQSSS